MAFVSVLAVPSAEEITHPGSPSQLPTSGPARPAHDFAIFLLALAPAPPAPVTQLGATSPSSLLLLSTPFWHRTPAPTAARTAALRPLPMAAWHFTFFLSRPSSGAPCTAAPLSD